ncbi:hypothetical protein JAO29_11320 [Edaphobacter sp. HDX4]|uniref:hypothetical protein n=1 Tax=Edaphobacter sp. HDX4 TaxID=2794064 RepID=UPI002FE66338
MPRHLSNPAALHSLLPKRRSDWQSLAKLAAYVSLGIICLAGLLYNKHRQQIRREQEWSSALATIEGTRIRLAVHGFSQFGGAMLYEVEVQARYSVDGEVREQWTTISQIPKLLADAQLQAHLLTKKQCIVRWRPNDPDHIVAEID